MPRFLPLIAISVFTAGLAVATYAQKDAAKPTTSVATVKPVAAKNEFGVTTSAGEKHLSNIRQLTFGGDNAEAYFSPDGTRLTLQVTNPAKGIACDQIYILDINNLAQGPITAANVPEMRRVSNGEGRTTCAFFMPDNLHVLYASTHEAKKECPAKPTPRADGKYLWAIYPEYDIYLATQEGDIERKLFSSPAYDAEATVSPKGDKIVFTSSRSGDLEVYTADINGENVKQITKELGYDGGACFSPDGQSLVFRASRPRTPEQMAEYRQLLSENLVAPTEMEIYTCALDGSEMRQVTKLGKANWAPCFDAKGEHIVFASNHRSERGYDFQLYRCDREGKNLEALTTESNFNAFPMFSPDGKHVVFSSNRDNGGGHDTNVFIADWVD